MSEEKPQITEAMLVLESTRNKYQKAFDSLKTSGKSLTTAAVALRKLREIENAIEILKDIGEYPKLDDEMLADD